MVDLMRKIMSMPATARQAHQHATLPASYMAQALHKALEKRTRT